MSQPLLQVENLHTHFNTRRGVVKAVDGVDFTVDSGEILGLLGESGCGKSVTSLTIMGLIPSPPGEVVEGRIVFDGEDLLGVSPARMRELRGGDISMIFQDPLSALNPVFTIGRQISEALICHGKADKKGAREKSVHLLNEVGIPEPDKRFDSYPHEMSGGMCQRVMIAMALACDPRLLIADEPTTALDVTIQKQILNLVHDLREQRNTAVLLITHDMGVIAENADRVAVMYTGKVVEEAPVEELFANPSHPYTHGLLKSIPDMERESQHLPSIPGMVPNLLDLPDGCAFAPRCKYADDECRAQAPERIHLSHNHSVLCHKPLAGATS
ncbi:MAG: ABC transporter ATP-binding protein [Rhodospirillales bacterium]|jgi:oligopeptide/dipeptide ABC transporter ATP-binding protein|nr:ABC transporter ATP-binding protein [Rhodospirillales bacterium]